MRDVIMRFTLSFTVFVLSIMLIVMLFDSNAANAETRRIEAEAARESAAAQHVAEQIELTRAEGERAIIEAAAGAVSADTRAAHGTDYALGWQFILTFIGCSFVALLLCSIPIIYGRRHTKPALSGDVWQQRALYWQRVAWMLAGSLRARENLTVAERNVLQMAEREV